VRREAARHPIRNFFRDLGPGLITGAADDDPSGISTYSVTGAAFGFSGLWTALFSFPLMAAVQLMCARLGMVTGRGLAANIRIRYSKWVLWGACLLLLIANIFNIGADLAGMAAAMELVTGVASIVWTPLFALTLVIVVVFASYRMVASIFKWLTLTLFAYVVTAFLSRPDWGRVLEATLVPDIHWTKEYFAVLVGIFGTTISPYLFFWQSAQEVEEERSKGRNTVAKRQGATQDEMRSSRRDVLTGMFFSNLVMYFIILTTAATLNAHGRTHIESARDAAEALRPLAGNGAYLLFTLGIIGTGMLGVPVLAGSSAVGRLHRSPSQTGPEILWSTGHIRRAGHGTGVRRVQFRANAFPFGRSERAAGPSAGCPCNPAREQRGSDGHSQEWAAHEWPGLAVRRYDGSLRHCDVRDLTRGRDKLEVATPPVCLPPGLSPKKYST